MDPPPFAVRKQLEGWDLFWAELARLEKVQSRSSEVLSRTTARIRHSRSLESLAEDPVVSALRRLFRSAGCDPTRYRPASEALLRRVLKGNDLPSIHPLVDVNNCLSLELAVPCCVMAEKTFQPPLLLRSGLPGEEYESLKGPFGLDGKPLLVDALGPLDAPVTGSRRVMIREETNRAWLVAYLPEGAVDADHAAQVLCSLTADDPAVQIGAVGLT